MNYRRDVLRLLISRNSPLLITEEEYRGAFLPFLPLPGDNLPLDGEEEYRAQVSKECRSISAATGISVTDDYASEDIPPLSLAYYRIRGLITSSSRWYFSTRDFEKNLLLAESNPAVSCHFVHITSGGGEAWYLDRLSQTIRSLSKPFYVLIDQACASAAYYIGCHGTVVKALTQNDTIGCIGTMVSFWNADPYFEALGFRKIEEFATRSDLKNKKYRDLCNGKPSQYIKEELDPIQKQFEETVLSHRKKIAALKEDHPVLRGETFMSQEAVNVGLIDGLCTFPQALEEAFLFGEAHQKEKNRQRNRALSLI
jgi:ClpP class serine protease